MKKEAVYKEIKTLILLIVYSVVYSIGLKWFFEAIDPPLFSVGVPGIAQLIVGAFSQWASIDLGDIFLGVFILVGNIPTLLLAYFGVSKKFSIYSAIGVLIQMIIVAFLPTYKGLTAGLDPFAIAVIGGLIMGVGIGGALRIGTSLGGLDILSQYVSLKKGISVGFISLIINVSIAVLAGIIYKDPTVTAYTGIGIIITTLVTDKIHTAYQFLRVDIITDNYDELITSIIEGLYRGVTLIDVQGGYKRTNKTLAVVAIATYELPILKKLIQESDPNAFVIVQPVRHIYGNFSRKTIV